MSCRGSSACRKRANRSVRRGSRARPASGRLSPARRERRCGYALRPDRQRSARRHEVPLGLDQLVAERAAKGDVAVGSSLSMAVSRPGLRDLRQEANVHLGIERCDRWVAGSASRRTTSVIVAGVYFRWASQSLTLKPSTCGCSQLIRTSKLRRCLRLRSVTTFSFELLVHAGSARRVEQTEGFDPIPCDRRFAHWIRTRRVRGDPSGAACVVASEHGGRNAGGLTRRRRRTC
jgi:hypothetical protein